MKARTCQTCRAPLDEHGECTLCPLQDCIPGIELDADAESGHTESNTWSV